MARKQKKDVLVVGAGPVGQWVALLLAQRGVDVEVIDEETVNEGRGHAVVLHPASLQLLDDMGLAADLVKVGHPIDTIDCIEGDKRIWSIDVAKLPVEYPFALTVTLDHLQALLEKRLGEQGVHVQWRQHFAGLDRSHQTLLAEIDELDVVEMGYAVMHREAIIRRQWVMESDFIIGADGPHSVVRRRAELPLATSGAPHRFAVFEGHSVDQPGSAVKIVFHPDGTSVFWPLPGNRWRWLFDLGERSTEGPLFKSQVISALGGWATDNLDAQALEKLLSQRADWFRRPGLKLDFGFELVTEKRLASRFGEGGVWLAGDSAHLSGPFSNLSLNVGLREAHDLAWRLARILRSGAGRELMAAYDAERSREWRALLGMEAPTGAEPAPAGPTPISSFLPATGVDLGLLMQQVAPPA